VAKETHSVKKGPLPTIREGANSAKGGTRRRPNEGKEKKKRIRGKRGWRVVNGGGSGKVPVAETGGGVPKKEGQCNQKHRGLENMC